MRQNNNLWINKSGPEKPLPSSSCNVTVRSTYSHQCFPSVDTGISQLDHLQAKWMHTHATTVGLYCRQKVVRCKLQETRNNKNDCKSKGFSNTHTIHFGPFTTILLYNSQMNSTKSITSNQKHHITYIKPYLTNVEHLKNPIF